MYNLKYLCILSNINSSTVQLQESYLTMILPS